MLCELKDRYGNIYLIQEKTDNPQSHASDYVALIGPTLLPPLIFTAEKLVKLILHEYLTMSRTVKKYESQQH